MKPYPPIKKRMKRKKDKSNKCLICLSPIISKNKQNVFCDKCKRIKPSPEELIYLTYTDEDDQTKEDDK